MSDWEPPGTTVRSQDISGHEDDESDGTLDDGLPADSDTVLSGDESVAQSSAWKAEGYWDTRTTLEFGATWVMKQPRPSRSSGAPKCGECRREARFHLCT